MREGRAEAEPGPGPRGCGPAAAFLRGGAAPRVSWPGVGPRRCPQTLAEAAALGLAMARAGKQPRGPPTVRGGAVHF